MIVSDFDRIRLFDHETDKDWNFHLLELNDNIHLFSFISGYRLGTDYGEEEEASIKAARLMADFHNEIEKTGYDGHDLEVFMIRILFCFFADDTQIFDRNLFRAYIEDRTSEDGSDLGAHLNLIFETLNTPRDSRQTNIDEQLSNFPYVNGGIFKENIRSVSLDLVAREKLIKCCGFDWSNISASIFGSLFQGVMDEEERRQLGAHYTSELNIMKVIQPLFLDEIHIEFDKVKHSKAQLERFHTKLSELTFLDPACGCGNFLVVAYRELRKLEIDVIKALRRKSKETQDTRLFGADELSKINVNQFYGIEIEEFPALVARTAMYLVDHQMNRLLSETFGEIYARIPLREPAHIHHADALRIDWSEVIAPGDLSYILGNPPFLGARLMSGEQKDSLVALFPDVKGSGNLDFVTGWYLKACEYSMNTQIKTAFVSTNSIAQGEQVGILWKYLSEKYGVKIHFAHQTFKWHNDAPGKAAVYCIIVGFALYDVKKKYLYEYKDNSSEPCEREVDKVNFYLVKGDDVFLNGRSKPLADAPSIGIGNQPIDDGNFLFSRKEMEEFLVDEPMSEKYFFRWYGAIEFLQGKERWVLLVQRIEPSELSRMKKVLERIENVRIFRKGSKRKSTIKLADTPRNFQTEIFPRSNFLLIPKVSSENREYIPIGFMEPSQITSDLVFIVQDATLFHFGALQSRMHMTWMRYVCGRLKGDYRYSKDIVYNNFPWPQDVSGEQKEKVERLATAIIDTRAKFPESSLADLYNPLTMPPELTKAHQALDQAVDQCYGKKFTSDEMRIAHLFEMYEHLSASDLVQK